MAAVIQFKSPLFSSPDFNFGVDGADGLTNSVGLFGLSAFEVAFAALAVETAFGTAGGFGFSLAGDFGSEGGLAASVGFFGFSAFEGAVGALALAAAFGIAGGFGFSVGDDFVPEGCAGLVEEVASEALEAAVGGTMEPRPACLAPEKHRSVREIRDGTRQ